MAKYPIDVNKVLSSEDIFTMLFHDDSKENALWYYNICKTSINCSKDLARWLYGLLKVENTKIDIDKCFELACYNGHKNLTQLLYYLSIDFNRKINIYTNNELLRNVCKNGHKEIAEWLYYIADQDCEKS